jgi:hypothetical protein
MATGKSLVRFEVPSPSRRTRWSVAGLFVLGVLAGVNTLVFHLLPGRDVQDVPPAIYTASVLFAEPWIQTPLPIHVVPPRTGRGNTLRIDGLPPLALLSEGHATRPGSWTIPLAGLPTLKITAPATEDVKPRLTIALVSHDGIVLSEVRPLLAVVPAWRLGGLQSRLSEEPDAPCCTRAAQSVEPPLAWVSRGVRE